MTTGLLRRFRNFLGVGLVGFVVDAAIFFGAVSGLQWHYVTGRVLASLVALTVTWLLNRSLTFTNAAPGSIAIEFLRYLGASALGAGANLLTVMVVAPLDGQLNHVPAYLLGTFAGLIVNFTLYDRFVFKKK